MRNTTKEKQNTNTQPTTPIYGLLFEKLETTSDSYVLAFGDLNKVKFYKKDLHLKGEITTYKYKAWLVRRIEKIKYEYKNDVKLLFLE